MSGYKSDVGPPGLYDLIGAHQFCVMVKLGLRTYNTMLDIGCGSLRGGKLFIPYLGTGNYTGIDPNKDLVWAGVDAELGNDMFKDKEPSFYHWDDFKWADRLSDMGKPDPHFILAHSVLSHAGKELASGIVSEAAKSLAVGGTFAATFFLSMSDSTEEGWTGAAPTGFTEKTIKGIMRDAGFSSVSIRNLGHPMRQMWVVGGI